MLRMMQAVDPFGTDVDLPPAFVTRTRRSGLRVRHFLLRSQEASVTPMSMPNEDGYVAAFQLQDKPAHEFFMDGRSTAAPVSHKGNTHFVDLGTAPMSLLTGTVESLHIHIPQAALEDVVQDAGGRPISALRAPIDWNTQDTIIQRMGPLLLDAVGQSGPVSSLFVDHLLLALTTHLCVAYGGARPGQTATGGLAPWQVRRAKEMLASNLHKDVSLLEIAEACNLSIAHFSRAFRTSTGRTPHGWLQRSRVERARDLMLAHEASLAEIAGLCGFADQSHFTRIFKRSTGLGPGAWRRLHRES